MAAAPGARAHVVPDVAAALQLAREAAPGTLIATVIPDTGLKYLSTDLYPA